MKKINNYLSVEDQEKLLISRGMKISKGSKILHTYNYAHIVYIYANYFLLDKKYRENIKLLEVEKIYLMDLRIQSLIFTRIMKIEGKIRRFASKIIAEKFGPLGHKKIENYNENNKSSIKLKNKIKKIDRRSVKNEAINNISKYLYRSSLPVWIGVEQYELGTLLQLILKMPIKKDMAKLFGTNPVLLAKSIQNLRIYRNIISHKGTLFNTRISELRNLNIKNFYPYSKSKIAKDRRYHGGLTPILALVWFLGSEDEAKKLSNDIMNLINLHWRSRKYIANRGDLLQGFNIDEKIINKLSRR